jgi:hypothetical protein
MVSYRIYHTFITPFSGCILGNLYQIHINTLEHFI